jgi:hypothetical protein
MNMHGEIDNSKITVTMSMEDYEYYKNAVDGRRHYIKMLEKANVNGEAVMTEELKTAIEEIFQ